MESRVGVCFPGWLGSSVPDGGRTLRQQLIAPLKADVLLALTYHKLDKCSNAASCRLAERFPHLQPFTAVVLSPMLTVADCVQKMEALHHWPRILEAYSSPNSTIACRRDLDWSPEANESASPYRCHGLKKGNTLFAPVLGSRHLNVLRELHDRSRCLDLIALQEARSGVRYTRIVHTRLDLVWLRPHPPLSLLQPDAAVWLANGMDWKGYNDRHAVMSRYVRYIYLSIYILYVLSIYLYTYEPAQFVSGD